jgi:hypothetical protein
VRKIPALFLFFIVASCLNQANCLITSTNQVKIKLKRASDNTNAIIEFNGITVSGTSLSFYNNVATAELGLPVDPNASETTFLFTYNETVDGVTTPKTSRLTLGYLNEMRLISEACGAYQYQRDLEVIETDFIKTKLINTSLLTGVPSNLEIYF